METPEQMAVDYCEPILSDEYAKAIGREDWIGTRCVRVGEGHEMYKAFLAGYQAAKPQWISIHDELPKTYDDVLWCNPSSKIMTISAGNPKFDGDLNEQYFTYWMALPEPPKGEE